MATAQKCQQLPNVAAVQNLLQSRWMLSVAGIAKDLTGVVIMGTVIPSHAGAPWRGVGWGREEREIYTSQAILIIFVTISYVILEEQQMSDEE